MEEELIEKIKGLGQQVMQDWAEREEQAADKSFWESEEKVVSKGKKTLLAHEFWGSKRKGADLQVVG